MATFVRRRSKKTLSISAVCFIFALWFASDFLHLQMTDDEAKIRGFIAVFLAMVGFATWPYQSRIRHDGDA